MMMKMEGTTQDLVRQIEGIPRKFLLGALGPFVFNPLGNPQRLLSTGQRLEQFEPTVSTSKHIERFFEGSASSFIPRDLLQDHLLSDSSNKEKNQFHSNLLQGLKCSDGNVLVFFICGEGADRIASTVFGQESSGKWYSIPASLSSHSLDVSDQPDRFISPSLQHSIRQLSAVWADFSGKGGAGLAMLAARTDYYVYFYYVSIEEDRVQFMSTAKSSFQVGTTHVTWSPQVYGRAAVMLESGTLCLFDVKESQNSNSNSVVQLIPTATIEYPFQRSFAKLSSQSTPVRQNQDQEYGQSEPNSGGDPHDLSVDATGVVRELEKKWWCCEFGWLPHTLLVANCWEIFLVDLIEYDSTVDSSRKTETDAKTSTSGIDLMANVGPYEYSRFFSLKPGKENIVAFARDSGDDGMYEFSVATEHRVILFDSRQPQTPILQWEHAMKRNPPSLLIMCPLAALRYFHDKEKLEDIQQGRVILAVSFRSGDIRVFCYGSGISTVQSPMGNNAKKQKVQGNDWGNATYAWDIPSRLDAPLANVDDWRNVLSSSEGWYSHWLHVPKSGNGGQNIAGILLLSENSSKFTCNERKKTFTILQLTGQGELLAQTYAASDELEDPTKAGLSSIDDKSDAEESVGVQMPRYNELKFEVLPTFLNYIRTGSVLNPHSSRYSEKEIIVADDAGCTLNPGQDQASEVATSEWTKEDPPLLSPVVEKTLSKADLARQLKLFIQELSVPLNMYEVTRKVLGIGLPAKLSDLDPGIPSDLNATWDRGYKFPSVSPLLSSTVLSSNSGDPRREGAPSEATLLNGLTRKASFQETIPLPLLLEIPIIDKPNAGPSPGNRGKCCTNHFQSGHRVHGECLPDTKDGDGTKDKKDSLTFVDGHQLLFEGSKFVDCLIEKLISKNNETVISLSEQSDEWQENPNSDGQSDLQILLYTTPDKERFVSNSRRVDSDREEFDKATNIMHTAKSTEEFVRHDAEAKSRTLMEELCSKFVIGKASFENLKSSLPEQWLEIDPSLCPIKLRFTDPEEDLEPGELTALEDMQANFLQWQQSFSPYRTLH